MTPVAIGPPTTALLGRLAQVQEVLGAAGPSALDPGASPFDVVASLIETVQEQDHTAGVWLLVVALTGAYPRPGTVRSVRRAIDLKQTDDAVVWLLDVVTSLAVEDGNATTSLRIIADRPLVDVDASAKSGFLTGIQRVVRGVVSQWHDQHDVELVAWTARGGAYRSLTAAERARLLESEAAAFQPSRPRTARDGAEIVVPWGVPVVLTEVPAADMSDRLAEVAQVTRCSIRAVGYDCIPVSSAETVPLEEPEKFGHYLEMVKFAERVAGISRTAASEFEGFVAALGTQGLAGPRVTACPLPHTVTVSGELRGSTRGRPVVACVGTVGRRKNQVALVEASETLWREGLDFELRLLGHLGAERSPTVGLVRELQALGRPLVVESGVSDARIASTFAEARCLVFPSLHEGFGLPVVEALSHGVPVITSDFGSLREVADGQGGLLVDPEDVPALTRALRSLVTDDSLHARLRAQAAARPVRTWVEYAEDLWKDLVR